MRLPEVVNQAVGYVNSNLLTDSRDMRKAYRQLRSSNGLFNHSALPEPRKGRQPIIAATVEPYDVVLVHPNRASAGDLHIRTHKRFSELRFREEGGREVRPIDLCIELRDPDTWVDFAYLVAKGTVFAVSPPDRQTIDWEPNQGSSANVVYVNRAYPNESLAVARIAQKAVRSYRARQRYYRHIREFQ